MPEWLSLAFIQTWLPVFIQAILIPLALYAAKVTQDRDRREHQQWVQEHFVSKAEFMQYQREQERWVEERKQVIISKFDTLVELWETTDKRLSRIESTLDRRRV